MDNVIIQLLDKQVPVLLQILEIYHDNIVMDGEEEEVIDAIRVQIDPTYGKEQPSDAKV